MTKQDGLNKLLDYRSSMEKILTDIDAVLQLHFPEEYALAYQHWMPQIRTALRDDTKWLPRGQYSMDYTINHISDQINGSLDKGVSKFIK
jgi:hypothetical protein